MPQLWVIAGPNGAGKTTLVSRHVGKRIAVVNPDEIAARLPRINGRLDERQAGQIALSERTRLLDERANFAIETTLTGNSTLQLMRSARERGYKNTLVFIGLDSPELSGQRVVTRVRQGGHAVPVSALARRYPNALTNLPTAMNLSDRTYLLDNSGSRRRLLLVREQGTVRYRASDVPTCLGDRLSTLPL